MLSPRLTNIAAGTSIPALIASIDRKLMELANDLYNNVVFSLNNQIDSVKINDLLNYKRILRYKYCNPNYASSFTVEMIASKVALYSPYNCSCSNFNIVYNGPGSTTTTTSSSTSSTTTTTTTMTLLSPAGPYGITNTICLVCLGDTTVAGACSTAIAFPRECIPYFYSASCTPLQVGCTLYTDIGLTIPVVGDPNNYCSDGSNSYQINGSGVILSITPCPAPPVRYSHCSSFVIPKIDGTPFTVGAVTVTCTYTGDVTTYPSTWPVVGTLDVFPVGSPWLGMNWNSFSLTFNFSAPVNNINIYQAGGDLNETYKFTTNAGTVSLIGHYLNNTTISGDTIQINAFVTDGSGNSIVEVSNSVPFTTLTISGYTTPGRPTNSWGSLFAICTQIV